MNKREQQLFNMVTSTRGFMDDRTAIWSAIPALTRHKNSLDSLITDIQTKEAKVIAPSKPTTQAKNKLKRQIALKANVLSGAAYAFAAENGNETLMAQTGISFTEIAKNIPEGAVPDRVQQLVTLLRENLEGLADQGVTEDQITDLETSVDDLRELIGKPRRMLTTQHLNGREVGALVKDAVELLTDRMDKTMMRFKLTNPSFFEGYTRARTIIDN